MQAMVLTGHGGMDKLVWHEDWPVPVPKAGEVLIKVGACGLNNTDVNTRSGWYSKTVTTATTGGAYDKVGQEDPSWGGAPLAFPRIQGADVAGTIVAVGSGVSQARMGERVIADCWLRDWSDPMNRAKTGYVGSECDGGFAQYVALDARNALAVDCGLRDAELATFSCSYSTAEGMLSRAGVCEADTVLVTGASSGIGAATAVAAARAGYDVAVCYFSDLQGAERTAEQVRELGRKAVVIQGDVSKPEDVEKMFAAFDAEFDELGALVNNAGVVDVNARVEEMSHDRLKRMFDTNTIGPFLCSKQAAIRMAYRYGGAGGVIVNVSSVAARLGSAGAYVDYAASKGAVGWGLLHF